MQASSVAGVTSSERAISRFATAYADRTESDYKRLLEAAEPVA
jgi:hypothetical protein